MVTSSVALALEIGSVNSFPIASRETSISTDTDSATPPKGGEKITSNTEMDKPSLLNRKKKPVPGKGFNKSRRGCFNCKRRRVKCSETIPECRGCNRMGLVCLYPESHLPTPKRLHSTRPSSVKRCVNLDHLRFYHHFLVEAYPPAPHGAEPVWHNVAAMSHKVCSCQYHQQVSLD